MNEQQLLEFLVNTLQPRYEKQFGTEYKKNIMNVSHLVSGMRSYIYHWKARAVTAPPPEFNIALLEGAAFHNYINQKLNDFDKHELRWILPYEWKHEPLKDIQLIGHFDNVLPINDKVLCEWKRTGQAKPSENGLLIRAKRQVGTYATILKYKTGVEYECFSVIATKDIPAYKVDGKIVRERIPGKLHIFKLSPEEIRAGWEFVRRTAYEVARELDQ